MQVTNHSNNKRKMKEELLEAIYGTVERLEQKVDELSASPKNAGTEPFLQVMTQPSWRNQSLLCLARKRKSEVKYPN